LDSYIFKFKNFLLTFCPLTPSLSPVGERVRVRGNFKYFLARFILLFKRKGIKSNEIY